MPYLTLILILLLGCQPVLPVKNGYTSVSQITKNGFARDKNDIRKLEGKEVKIWGYLDTHNISLRENIIKNQPSWWSETPMDSNAYFDLKSYISNESIGSIRVYVGRDSKKYKEIFKKFRDAKESETIVYVIGKIHTFEAPMNFNTSVGVTIKVNSPSGISIEAMGE